jgi:hypothetical protein
MNVGGRVSQVARFNQYDVRHQLAYPQAGGYQGNLWHVEPDSPLQMSSAFGDESD